MKRLFRVICAVLLLAVCVSCTQKKERELVLIYDDGRDLLDCDELRRHLQKGLGVPIADIEYEYIDGGCMYTVLFEKPLTKIAPYAFDSYSSACLYSVRVPDTVTKIKDSAFYDCDSLMEASLPEKVQVGAEAFPATTKIRHRTPAHTITSLKGLEWLEGKWVADNDDLFSEYNGEVGILITKKYYQEFFTWEDGENAVVEDQPKEKLVITDASPEADYFMDRDYKRIGGFYIDDVNQQLIYEVGFDAWFDMKKVEESAKSERKAKGGISDRRKGNAERLSSESDHSSESNQLHQDPPKQEPVVFRSGQSVLPYLSSRVFRSADGRSKVQILARGVFLNGSQIADAPSIEYVEETYAVVFAYTPRNSRYRFGVLPQEDCIVDLNDNIRYYCK